MMKRLIVASVVWVTGCLGSYAPMTAGDASVSRLPSNDGTSNRDGSVDTPTGDGSSPSASPTALVATPGDTQVFLSWTATSGATGYHVKRSTTSGGPYTQVAMPTTPSYTDTGLTNGTAYYYVVAAVGSAGEGANSAEASATPEPIVTSKSCGMQLGDTPITFCEPFDAPGGTTTRSGDLDGNVWGVSRDLDGVPNFGGQLSNEAPEVTLQTCSGDKVVRPPNDVVICNGQLHEATNDNKSGVFDNGTVTTLAMYPKQPFDFAGRTGTVSFDVSNDSHANHSSWPEFWMSDLPVPAPFNHFDSWQSLPDHGFGIRFAAQAEANSYGLCPNGNNLDKSRWTVDSAVVVRNYVLEDHNYQGLTYGPGSAMKLNILDCVVAPADGSGVTNHVEIRVSQNEIDIYAADAGVAATATNLKKIASITDAGLTFTRGLVWLEDVHYNADKGGMPSQRQHTFVWDNLAFDGPFTYRDFAYDAPDSGDLNSDGAMTWNGAPTMNLGKASEPGQTASWSVPGMPANPKGSAARVLFQFSNVFDPNPATLIVNVNGHAHPTAWPYPDTRTNTWRTFAVTIPLTDLVAGTNTVELGSDQGMISSNVDIVLVDVPGGVPVLPGNKRTYPSP